MKYLRPPLSPFNQTHTNAQHNSNILSFSNGYLGGTFKYQQGIPLDYGSELWDPKDIADLFKYHTDKDVQNPPREIWISPGAY